MQRSLLAKSLSRRQVLAAIAAGATCVATEVAAVAVLDVATAGAASLLDPQHATSTAPFVLSF